MDKNHIFHNISHVKFIVNFVENFVRILAPPLKLKY